MKKQLITHEQAQRVMYVVETLRLKTLGQDYDKEAYQEIYDASRIVTPNDSVIHLTLEQAHYQNIGKDPDDENRLARPRLLIDLFASASSAAMEELRTSGPITWLGIEFSALHDKRSPGYYRITLEVFVEGNHARPVCG